MYNPEAIKWLLDFFVKPHQTSDIELKKAAKLHYYSMKQKTKEEFLKNWDNILQGRSVRITFVIIISRYSNGLICISGSSVIFFQMNLLFGNINELIYLNLLYLILF